MPFHLQQHTRRPRHGCAAALALFLLCSAWVGGAMAQANPSASSTPKKPKIGLVLSGGGALGIAHVGAIQELEKLGIRPDLIVGTSMGAVVGGLYASGLDGQALEKAVNSTNWDAIFDASPQRDDLRYRQKAQETNFPVKIGLGLEDGALTTPEGAVSDQNLMLELRRLVPVSTALATFDQLPIPFRAVATDIASGERVVLDSGELASAMRASMSVPGVFAPVRIGSRLLVDGGLTNNIPIDVARAMGADIVIVVAFTTSLLPPEKIGSVLNVLSQTVSMLVLFNERVQLASLKSGDVLVMVDTGKLGTTDFKRGEPLMALGRQTLLTQTKALQAIADNREVVAFAPLPTPPVIAFVRLENNSILDDAVVSQPLTALVGKPLDAQTVARALNRVYALGEFERVDYAVEPGKGANEGKSGLVVRAAAKRAQSGKIRLGLALENNFQGEAKSELALDYRSGALDRYGSDLQLQAAFGARTAISAEYFKLYNTQQSWFTSARIEAQRRPVDAYAPDGFKVAGYSLAYGLVQLAGGYQLGGFGEVRLGLDRGAGSVSLTSGIPVLTSTDIRIGNLVASAGVDTLDSPFFPRSGSKLDIRWTRGMRSLGGAQNYQSLALNGLRATHWGSHGLVASASLGSNLKGTSPVDGLFRLGGLFSLSGYRQEELSGEAFAAARLVYRYWLPRDETSLFGLPLSVGASLEGGQVWARREDVGGKLRLGGSLFASADTTLGPVYLAYGFSANKRRTLYLLVGKSF